MAIARVDTTTNSVSDGTVVGSITATAPTGVQSGDLIIVAACVSSGVADWSATSYTGWTIAEDLVETSLKTRVIYRIADGTGTDNPPAMDPTTNGHMVAQAAAYRGVDTATPFIAEAGQIHAGGSSTLHTAPSITNTDANAWAVLAGHARQVATPLTWTPGPGLVELEDDDTGNATTSNASAMWADSNGPVATGSVAYEASTSSATPQACLWAAFLKPASGGGSITGTGALAAGAATLSGSGTITNPGTGALTAPAATLSGTGTITIPGTGALTAPTATLSGTGTVGSSAITGTGALTAPAATLSGAGVLSVAGTGTLIPEAPTLAAIGVLTIAGEGALVSVAFELSADGLVYDDTIVVTVPADRTLLVPAENRTLAVPAENRTLAVPAENRTLTA